MELPEVTPLHIADPTRSEKLTRRIGAVMTRPFGVRLDPETSERWKEVVSLFRITDDFLDEFDDIDFHERIELILQHIYEPGQFSAWFSHLTAESLGEQTYNQVQRYGAQIVRTNYFIKTTDDPHRYMALRQFEGRTSSRMLDELTSPEFRSQPHYERFQVGLDWAGEVINLADSVLDLHEDFTLGEVNFRPTTSVYAHLLGRSALRSLYYAPKIFSAR